MELIKIRMIIVFLSDYFFVFIIMQLKYEIYISIFIFLIFYSDKFHLKGKIDCKFNPNLKGEYNEVEIVDFNFYYMLLFFILSLFRAFLI